jgi:hypothetical protein
VIRIDVRPAGPGTYEARLAGRVICVSRQPFLDSARALLQEGYDPTAVLIMRWSTTGTESLSDTQHRRRRSPSERTPEMEPRASFPIGHTVAP